MTALVLLNKQYHFHEDVIFYWELIRVHRAPERQSLTAMEKELGSAESEHNIKYFTDGRVEHSPEDMWNALKTSVARGLGQTGIKGAA